VVATWARPSRRLLTHHERNQNERKEAMYYQAISQCTQMLKNLESWLDKAEEYAGAKTF